MDGLLASFSSVEVTAHPNTPHAEHPHFALYKQKSSGSSQTERRKRVLEARREARYDLLSHLRSIEDEQLRSDDSSDDMDLEQARECYKRPKKYKDFLMLSEWLVDVPSDFATTYFTVPCPVGKRSLVLSAKGKTRAFTKSGYQANQFPSMLPGGSRRNSSVGYALLDCIWSEIDKTFYVLDIMCWLNQPVIECDTFFRFEWLKSRFEEEVVGISEVSKYNPNKFVRLPYYDSSSETLTKLFKGGNLPFSAELDGILFYSRESHYTHGPTPLIGWLKAFMLPEILGIPVAEKFQAERPAKYTTLTNHIQYAAEMREKKKNKMDVTSENGQKEVADEMESDMTASEKNSEVVSEKAQKNGEQKTHKNGEQMESDVV